MDGDQHGTPVQRHVTHGTHHDRSSAGIQACSKTKLEEISGLHAPDDRSAPRCARHASRSQQHGHPVPQQENHVKQVRTLHAPDATLATFQLSATCSQLSATLHT